MKPCPKCEHNVADALTECPHCGIVFEKFHERVDLKAVAVAAAAAGIGGGAGTAAADDSASKSALSFFKIRYFLLVAVALAAYKWMHPAPQAMPSAALAALTPGANASAESPCQHRPYCAYIYVAPWCPHCQEFLPEIARLRTFWQSSDRPGIFVVVGWDEEKAMAEMVERISPPAFVDSQQKFRSALKINSVPRIFIVDAQQIIVASGSRAQSWIENEVNAHPSR